MKLQVLRVTPNQRGGFVTKFRQETIENIAGFEKRSQLTYYMSSTKHPVKELTEDGEPVAPTFVDLPMDKLRIEEHEGLNPSTGELIPLKWLHLR